MDLLEARTYHLRSIRSRHGASSTGRRHPTEQLYQTYWDRYLAYLEEHGFTYELGALNPALVEDCMLWMRDKPLIPGTRRGGEQAVKMLVIVLKVAARFLTKRHVYATDPLAALEVPRVAKVHRAPFTEDEARRILGVVAEGRNPIRDRAIMLLLASSGCRVGELCGLEIGDVLDGEGELTGKLVFRRTKNGNPRAIVIRQPKFGGGRAMQALKLWLRLRRAQPGVAAVFVTEDGYPLEVRRVQDFHRRYGQQAKVVDCFPHRWRHTNASEAFAEGLREEELRSRLGHMSREVLRDYLTIGDRTLDLAAARADLAEKWHL